MNATLTQQLLSLSKEDYAAATTHPFLVAAGRLTLSPQALQSWLAQDRFYALLGYTKFLGRLIAKIPSPEEDPDTVDSKVQRRRLAVLAGAMANIDREVNFFENVARENGLDLAAKARDGSVESVSDKTKVRESGQLCAVVDTLLSHFHLPISYYTTGIQRLYDCDSGRGIIRGRTRPPLGHGEST